jgi:hypothetical protein
MHKLPKRTKAQRVGQSAADLFSAIFTEFCNVIPVPQDRDLGIDFICEIMQEEHPTGKRFNVQCKGKEEVQTEGNKIQVPIRVETLNYWFLQENPTFLIVVDCQNCIFYWSFPESFLDSLNREWQEQKNVSIPVPTDNHFNQDIAELPFEFITKIHTHVPSKLRHGENFKLVSPRYEESPTREEMTIKELMRYYLEGARIANVEGAQGTPGFPVTVYPETFGGKYYTTAIKARVWGILDGEAAILLQLPCENNYVLSYETFREICSLLSSDFSTFAVAKFHTSQGGYPGGQIYVQQTQEKLSSATVWYEMPPGDLKLFELNGKRYAISLVASKTVSAEKIEKKSGRYLNPDPRREIVWHYFDLFGHDYSLPLKLGESR